MLSVRRINISFLWERLHCGW